MGHNQVLSRDQAKLVRSHKINEEIGHVLHLNRAIQCSRAYRSIFGSALSPYPEDECRVVDDVVLIPIKIAPAEHTGKISVSLLTEDNAMLQLSERRVPRRRDRSSNLQVSGMHGRRPRDKNTTLDDSACTFAIRVPGRRRHEDLPRA